MVMAFLRGMKYVEVVTLFVFVMLVVSLFYGNSIWSFPLSIFAMALFMQYNYLLVLVILLLI